RYKFNNTILADLQKAHDTDEENEFTEDEDTEVEEEEELETPKIHVGTGIRIVGYLLKDGTYVKSLEDAFKPRPSLASITEVPFRFTFPTPMHKEAHRDNIESEKDSSVGNKKDVVRNILDRNKETGNCAVSNFGEKVYTDTDKNDGWSSNHSKIENNDHGNFNMSSLSKSLQRIESIDLEDNSDLLEIDSKFLTQSLYESPKLRIKKLSKESIKRNSLNVKDQIAKIEKQLSTSSPDEAEIDFDKVFSQEEIKKRDKTEVKNTNNISKNKERKIKDKKQEEKKKPLLRESTRQMLAFISDVHSDNERGPTERASENERDDSPRRKSL
ncbi:unnamed protein product, partial [Meganyctiphanes norvegica]